MFIHSTRVGLRQNPRMSYYLTILHTQIYMTHIYINIGALNLACHRSTFCAKGSPTFWSSYPIEKPMCYRTCEVYFLVHCPLLYSILKVERSSSLNRLVVSIPHNVHMDHHENSWEVHCIKLIFLISWITLPDV